MIVRVTCFAQLAAAIGVAEDEVELPDGARVVDLFAALAARAEGARALLLDDAGAARPSVLAFVDDAQVDAGAPLAEGAAVFLATPISGG